VVSIVDKNNPRVFEAKFATYLDGAAAAPRVAQLVAK
jgi:hypothetical protein